MNTTMKKYDGSNFYDSVEGFLLFGASFLKLGNTLHEALINASWAVVFIKFLNSSAIQMWRKATTDGACPDSFTRSRSWTRSTSTYVFNLLFELAVRFPCCVAHRNEDSLQSHLMLPLFLGHVIFHAAVDAHRVVTGLNRVCTDTVLVKEALVPIMQEKTARWDNGIGMVVRSNGFDADRALCVVVFFSAIRIRNVKIAEGLEFITKSSHAWVGCATRIVPRSFTASKRTNDLMKKIPLINWREKMRL